MKTKNKLTNEGRTTNTRLERATKNNAKPSTTKLQRYKLTKTRTEAYKLKGIPQTFTHENTETSHAT